MTDAVQFSAPAPPIGKAIKAQRYEGNEYDAVLLNRYSKVRDGFRWDGFNAVLIAGDADCVRLVDEVKQLGNVYLSFFQDEGLSPELHMAADFYVEMTGFMIDEWIKYLNPPPMSGLDDFRNY